MYELSSSGIYEGWSPLFDYSSAEMLAVSEDIPVPNDKFLASNNLKFGSKLNLDVSEDVLNYIEADLRSRKAYNTPGTDAETTKALNAEIAQAEKTKLESLINIIKALNTGQQVGVIPNLNVLPKEAYMEYIPQIIELIDEHQTFKFSDNGGRNIVASNIRKTINNVRNVDSAYSPVDMSCVTGPMNRKLEGIGGHKNLYDGFTVSEITEENATGKAVVGVMANGVKAFFTITQYLNRYYLKHRNELNMSDPEYFIQQLVINGTTYNVSTISDTDLTKNQKGKLLEQLKQLYGDSLVNENLFGDDDASLLISAFVSLATDNAKELALAKLNAGIELASIHVYLSMLGFSPEVIVDYTTTDLFKAMADQLKPNIFMGVVNVKPDFIQLRTDAIEGNAKWTVQEVNQLEKIYKASKEIKDLTAVLGINQGLSAKLDGIFSFKEKFGRAWKNMLEANPEFSYTDAELEGEENKFNGLKYNTPYLKVFRDFIKKGVTHNFAGVRQEKEGKRLEVLQMMAQASPEMKQAYTNALELGIDFDLYFLNEAYRNFIVSVYDLYKCTFNVYDIINKSPNFNEMIKATYQTGQELSYVSGKFDFQYNKAKDLYNRGMAYIQTIGYKNDSFEFKFEKDTKGLTIPDLVKKLLRPVLALSQKNNIKWWQLPEWSSKMSNAAGAYWDEMTIRRFFKSALFDTDGAYRIDPDALCEWYSKTFLPEGKVLTKNKVLRSKKANSDTYNLRFLKNFIEVYVIPAYSGSNEYRNNAFLQNIVNKIDKSDKVNKLQFKISMHDMVSDSEIILKEEIQQDFDRLAEEKVPFNSKTTATIGDLLYLYNLIVNKDKFGPYRLSAIFANYIQKPSSILAKEFLKFQILHNNDSQSLASNDVSDAINFVMFMNKGILTVKDKETQVVEGYIDLYDESGKKYSIEDPLFATDVPVIFDNKRLLDIEKIINLLKNGDLVAQLIC